MSGCTDPESDPESDPEPAPAPLPSLFVISSNSVFVSAALGIQPLFGRSNLPVFCPCRLADCHPGAAGVRRRGHPGGLLGGRDLALPGDPEAALPHRGRVAVHRR